MVPAPFFTLVYLLANLQNIFIKLIKTNMNVRFRFLWYTSCKKGNNLQFPFRDNSF